MSSCSRKGDKRSKSALELRVAIIFLGSIRIKAITMLEILGIIPRKSSYKHKTMTLSYVGSTPRQFLEFDS